MNYFSLMIIWCLVTNCYSETWHDFRNYEYYISPSDSLTKKFDGAQSACNAMDANLAKVNTNEIQQFLTETINSMSDSVNTLYIGLKWNSSTNEYHWLDGTMLNVTQWGLGQPNSNHACVVMSNNLGYLWDDLVCDTWTSYICSRYSESFTGPSTTGSSTSKPPTPLPSTSRQSTSRPSTSRPSTSRPSTPRPSTPRPSTPRPSTSRPSISSPSTSRPFTQKPSTTGSVTIQSSSKATVHSSKDTTTEKSMTRDPATVSSSTKGDTSGDVNEDLTIIIVAVICSVLFIFIVVAFVIYRRKFKPAGKSPIHAINNGTGQHVYADIDYNNIESRRPSHEYSTIDTLGVKAQVDTEEGEYSHLNLSGLSVTQPVCNMEPKTPRLSVEYSTTKDEIMICDENKLPVYAVVNKGNRGQANTIQPPAAAPNNETDVMENSATEKKKGEAESESAPVYAVVNKGKRNKVNANQSTGTSSNSNDVTTDDNNTSPFGKLSHE